MAFTMRWFMSVWKSPSLSNRFGGGTLRLEIFQKAMVKAPFLINNTNCTGAVKAATPVATVESMCEVIRRHVMEGRVKFRCHLSCIQAKSV